MDIVLWWFVLAVVMGIVAAAAGRSGFGFFLLSLILSPLLGFLALIVMLLAGMGKPASSVRDDRARIACPQCAELVLPQAQRCPHCGFGVAQHLHELAARSRAEEDQRMRARSERSRERGERLAATIRSWFGFGPGGKL